MNFVIEPEGAHLHWVVKVYEKGKLLELHRFYRSPENFLHHRGNHGAHEIAAQNALLEHFKTTPGLEMGEPKPGRVVTKR